MEVRFDRMRRDCFIVYFAAKRMGLATPLDLQALQANARLRMAERPLRPDAVAPDGAAPVATVVRAAKVADVTKVAQVKQESHAPQTRFDATGASDHD